MSILDPQQVELFHTAQSRRDKLVSSFLDITLAQWTEALDQHEEFIIELERLGIDQVVADVIQSLGHQSNDPDGQFQALYLRAIAMCSDRTLEVLVQTFGS